ncbi:hypothetical protein HDV05_008725 [Chytridiales sp. JEL 0842]|nr:hypothetical protein HDV05_008725 [Chytridiales sp. JEL 0842]
MHNRLPIPNPADYDIHPTRGFMPCDPPPLSRLPAYFEPWEKILDDLQRLLLAGRLRSLVEELPMLSTSHLQSHREWQRAYLVLSFLGQAYVWGKNVEPAEVIPAPVAVPWLQVCCKLDLKPIISYSSVELYNFKLLDPSLPWDLSNLSIMHTFSGSMDEAWFYLISLAMEAAGAPAIRAIVDGLKKVEAEDVEGLIQELEVICGCIDEINKILVRMYEKCDAHIFFNRVRPYVNGWENCDDLPRGILYEGVFPSSPENDKELQTVIPNSTVVPGKGTYGKYSGASAGQSSMIHLLDLALGVTHTPTRWKGSTESLDSPSATNSPREVTSIPTPAPTPSPPPKNFIHEMRNYMPGPHREFLYAISRSYSIRSFVQSNIESKPLDPLTQRLSETFNRAVEGMKSFRDKHIQMVSVYIIVQARKRSEGGVGGEVKKERITEALMARGTGGTDLMPFLKQSRDETREAKVEV